MFALLVAVDEIDYVVVQLAATAPFVAPLISLAVLLTCAFGFASIAVNVFDLFIRALLAAIPRAIGSNVSCAQPIEAMEGVMCPIIFLPDVALGFCKILVADADGVHHSAESVAVVPVPVELECLAFVVASARFHAFVVTCRCINLLCDLASVTVNLTESVYLVVLIATPTNKHRSNRS